MRARLTPARPERMSQNQENFLVLVVFSGSSRASVASLARSSAMARFCRLVTMRAFNFEFDSRSLLTYKPI